MSVISDMAKPFAKSGRIRRCWPSLRAEYAWLPPFEGEAVTNPNRIEGVFTSHDRVAARQAGKRFDVNVTPGAMYIVGSEPTILNRVMEFSDTVELYPSEEVMASCAHWYGLGSIELQPTLGGFTNICFEPKLSTLSAGHVLRKACLGLLNITAIEADHLAHLLLFDLLVQQGGIKIKHPPAQLSDASRKLLLDFIEERLTGNISLAEMACIVNMSPFHFARCFKSSTGMTPHGYVTARRLEHAKQQLLASNVSVRDIAWGIGYENISHFRRQFVMNFGVRPGEFRRMTLTPQAA